MRKFISALASLAVIAGVVAYAAEGSDTKPGPIAASADQAKPITVGDSIPDVVIQDGSGADVNLKEFTAGKKTALIFYRGGWCPFCNKHLADVAAAQDEIAKAGYQVIGINPDSPKDVMSAQEKKNFPFTILSDSDLKAARAFGVAFKLDDKTIEQYKGYGIRLMDSSDEPRYSLPVPAFYLVDASGKVTFEYHNPDYTVRISKEELLAAVRAN